MSSDVLVYLDDQLTTLWLSSTDKNTISKRRELLRDTLIAAINKQLVIYSVKSLEAVEQEVYEEILRETNFQKLEAEVVEHIRDQTFIDYRCMNLAYSRPTETIKLIDEKCFDEFADGKITDAEFKEHLANVYASVRLYEEAAIRYKRELKSFICKCIPYLCRKFELIKHRNESTFKIGRFEYIEVPQTLREFVKLTIERVLDVE